MFKIIKEFKKTGLKLKDIYEYIKHADRIKNRLKLIKYFIENFLFKLEIKSKKKKDLTISFNNLLVKFSPFSGELTSYKEIFIYKKYEKHPLFNPSFSKIVFDIGANIGLYSMRIAKSNKFLKVYSFEPNPYVFERLKFNIGINNLKNVFIFNKAVGSENKIVKFEIKENTLISKIFEGNKNEDKNLINVEMIKIDDFVKEYKIPYIDILKIDVEGYAFEVIKGACETLPIIKGIVMEHHPPYENIEKIESFLKSYNFKKILMYSEYVYFINEGKE